MVPGTHSVRKEAQSKAPLLIISLVPATLFKKQPPLWYLVHIVPRVTALVNYLIVSIETSPVVAAIVNVYFVSPAVKAAAGAVFVVVLPGTDGQVDKKRLAV